MFSPNGRHSRSPNASQSNVDHGMQYGFARRQMGPPQLNYPPQPVEIDPVSYPRVSGPYPPWEAATYPISSFADLTAPFSNIMNHTKTIQMSPDVVAVPGGSQDPLANWYHGNDGPWVAKGAVPEVAPDNRFPSKGYSPGYRASGYGLQSGINPRRGKRSDNGSLHFGIPPSDSGYGTGLSLENASVRSYDFVDHNLEGRSFTGRGHDFQPCGSLRGPPETETWTSASPDPSPYRCETCQKPVKTQSELKKHKNRHTKPFTCRIESCNRKEGFSTRNDLDRHMRSKHPNDIQDDRPFKTYHCLVVGCRSKDKNMPRLDNFRSHLRRMHHLSDDDIDTLARRADVDQGPKYSQLSQGIPTASQRILDQRDSQGEKPADFPDFQFDRDDAQWSSVSPRILGRQAEMIDPALESADTQTLVPISENFHNGMDHQESRESLEVNGALREPDARNGCLEKETKLQPPGLTGENTASPSKSQQGSTGTAGEPKDVQKRVKIGKKKRGASPVDPCLRKMITAALSKANLGKHGLSDQGHSLSDQGHGLSDQECDSLQSNGSPGIDHTSGISPCRIDSRVPLPSPAVTSAGQPDDPCLDALPTFGSDKEALTDRDHDVQWLIEVIKNAGYVLKKTHKTPAGLGHNTGHSGSGIIKKRDQVTCWRCNKLLGRPCELKKHMKRHERPYGCTYKKCTKKFGSKNDWKRHENSQHFQIETWQCDEKTDGVPCGRMFYTADNARTHLTKVHKVDDTDAVERKIDTRRIGPNNQVNFWCGFCVKIVDLNEKGVAAWTERFDHIDDHFMGRNGKDKQSIAQWTPEDGVCEGLYVSPKPASPNGEGGEGSSEDSSTVSCESSSTSRSPEASMGGRSDEAAPLTLKRPISDDEEGRPSKHARTGRSEVQKICCQCQHPYNMRTDTACPLCPHVFCNQCTSKRTWFIREQ